MSSRHTRSGQVLGLEKFSGNTGEYTMWRDKVLTHIAKLDQEYDRVLLEKDQPAAHVLMVDFLDSTPEKPIISVEGNLSQKEVKNLRWRLQHWTRAHAEMLNLFNQALPNVFLSGLSDQVSRMSPYDIWKELEQKYGLGDAGGVIELRRQWERLTTANWSNLGTLFSQLKKLRNDVNRKIRSLVGKEMVTETWLCMEVLFLLPSEFWGSSTSMTEEWFTIKNVEISLRRVFGDCSRKEIGMLTEMRRPVSVKLAKKHLGKKRRQDEASSQVNDGCFYCFEEGHMKVECPVKAKDRDPNRQGGPLFRTNIRTAPGGKKKRLMTVTKTAVKATSAVLQAQRTPAEAVLFDNDLEKALTDADELEFKGSVPMSEGDGNSPKNPLDMDDEVRCRFGKYLTVLKRLKVTDDLWVVDTGAGHAISSDQRWFSSLRNGDAHIFEYGNRGTSTSTLQETVGIRVLNPKRYYDNISIENVAYDKECDSNLLSAYYMATQGYRHIQSKTGEYLYFLDRQNHFVFAAVAINEVYYLPSKMIKTKAKELMSNTITVQAILQEWHLRLGHVGKDRLMRILSGKVIDGVPQLVRKYMEKVAFFCRTCALSKSKRMSYRNMKGERGPEPLHTLYMDSLGKMRVKGLYGTAGYVYALAVVDDATAHKWYFVLKSLKEVGGKIKQLITQLEKQFPYKVKLIKTDGGTEFVNKVLIQYCPKQGIVFQRSNVESEEENGAAERAHQTIMCNVRCALVGSGMATKWWPEVLMYVTAVANRLPVARLQGKSPYEALYGKKIEWIITADMGKHMLRAYTKIQTRRSEAQ